MGVENKRQNQYEKDQLKREKFLTDLQNALADHQMYSEEHQVEYKGVECPTCHECGHLKRMIEIVKTAPNLKYKLID